MTEVEFHCKEGNYFTNGCLVRAFSYKEYSIQMHNHVFYEINIVLNGSGTHCIENGHVKAKRGDVFVIPPMVAHAYIDTENLEVYHIVIHKDFFRQSREESRAVPGFLQLMEIEPVLRSNIANANFLHLNSNQLFQFTNEIEFIDDKCMKNPGYHYLIKYHATWKILYWFAGLLHEQIQSAKRRKNHKYEKQILQSLEYIHLHYSDKITVDSLCERAYLSRSTFLRSFREICGTTPVAYLTRYRCQKAAELLEIKGWNKTEIAHACGFYDLSHMERIQKENLKKQ